MNALTDHVLQMQFALILKEVTLADAGMVTQEMAILNA